MRIIKQEEEFTEWINSYNSQEVYVKSISFNFDSTDISGNVDLTLSPYQITALYGETYNEFFIKLRFKENLSVTEFDSPDHSKEISFEALKNIEFRKYELSIRPLSEGLGLYLIKQHFSVSQYFLISAGYVEILTENEIQTSVEPILSNDSFEIEIKTENLPEASKIKRLYKKNGLNIHFEDYWDTKIPEKDINTNLHGVYIKDSGKRFSAGMQMKISDTEGPHKILRFINFSDDPPLFDVLIQKVIAAVDYEVLHCGNMKFTKPEWEKSLEDRSHEGTVKISTTET